MRVAGRNTDRPATLGIMGGPAMHRRDMLKAVPLLVGARLLTPPVFAAAANAASDEPIQLRYNENPRGAGPLARQAVLEHLALAGRYSAPYYQPLLRLLALRERVPEDHIVLGAGSMEVLHAAALLAGLAGKNILAPYPTYETVSRHAALVGARTVDIPLGDDFLPDLEAMTRALDASVGLVYICNPNNPTGAMLNGPYLRRQVGIWSWQCPVLVDEAYLDYADAPQEHGMIELVREGREVIVTRTFSKLHGLAGLRIGYGIAPPELAARLREFCGWSSVNILALVAAEAALKDISFQERCLAENREVRAYMTRSLQKMGLAVVPSAANFVFFHTGRPLREFRASIQRHGILVGRAFPPYLDWCRVTVGDMEQARRCLRAVRRTLGIA